MAHREFAVGLDDQAREATGREGLMEVADTPFPGVKGLEHTADLGLELEAPSLPELFLRAARGAMWMVLERWPPASEEPDSATRKLELAEETAEALFRAWLRSLLLWEELDGFVTTGARISLFPSPACGAPDGLGLALTAQVEGAMDEGPRVREIKGVTLHGLRVERVGDDWHGQVIFDV